MKGSISGWHGLAGVLLATLACTQTSSTASTLPWLEITGLSNDVVHLVLHGTEPYVTYEIQSTEDLTQNWDYETMVAGTAGLDSLAFQLTKGGRTNALFIRARSVPGGDPTDLPLSDLQLWLKADAGVVHDGTNAAVSFWSDQSGSGNHAIQTDAANQPSYVEAVINGRPGVRFDAGSNSRMLLPDFVSGNTAGEIFAVLKVATNTPGASRGLWHLGIPVTANYYPHSSGAIYEGLGRTDVLNTGVPSQQIDEFHLYNVSAIAGAWASRINGKVHYETEDITVGFPTSVYLGGSGAFGPPAFDGDLAEVMLFDRALTASERDAVGYYLNQKYQWLTQPPTAPSGLRATALATNQVSLTWTNSLSTDTTVYRIERKLGSGGTYAEVAEVSDATSYIDLGVNGGTLYDYRLKAWNHAGESAYSDPVSVTTPGDGGGVPLEDVQLWLKADAGVVRNGTNGRVGLWLDQSGNGHHASQTYSANQPSHVEAVVSGRPVVRFDASSVSRMNLPDFVSGNTAGEIFAVLKATTNDPPTHRGLWRFGSSSVANYYPSASGTTYEGFGRGDLLNTGLPVQSVDEFHLYDVSASSSSWNSRINGQLHHSTAGVSPQFPTVVRIGSSGQYGTPTFDGDIAEVMLFDRVLTIAERGTVGLYLNGKYQIVNLPTGAIELAAQTLSSSQIALAWTQAGATNETLYTYTVERRLETNGTFVAVAQVTGDTRYFDEGLLSGTTYSYRVKNTFNIEAEPSNDVVATSLESNGSVPLAAVALWFRADDLSATLTNGASVLEWTDFVNADRKAVQPDPQWQPHLLASNFNGRATVRFDAGEYLELPSVLSNLASAEIFIVLRSLTNTPAANQGLWQFNSSGATWFPDTNGAVIDAFGSSSPNTSLAPLPHLTNALIYSVAADSNSWQSRMNGPLKQRLSPNTVVFDGVSLLGRSVGGASEPFAGDIAELIVFNRILALDEQKAVRDGLALKYGIPLEWPEIPDNLSLVATNETGNLAVWTALVGSENGLESYFVVERQAGTNAAFLPIATVARTESSALDMSGLSGIDYRYRLRAINDVGQVASDPLPAPPTDRDNDGLSDAVEEILGTDPDTSDTDGDGLPDHWEVEYGLNPLRADGIHGASGDFDNDGVSNLNEYQNETNPADGVHGEDPFIRLRVHRPN